MSAVATTPRPATLLPDLHGRPPKSSATLGEHLDEVLETMERDGLADCLMCEGRMLPAAVGARCVRCGTQLC